MIQLLLWELLVKSVFISCLYLVGVLLQPFFLHHLTATVKYGLFRLAIVGMFIPFSAIGPVVYTPELIKAVADKNAFVTFALSNNSVPIDQDFMMLVINCWASVVCLVTLWRCYCQKRFHRTITQDLYYVREVEQIADEVAMTLKIKRNIPVYLCRHVSTPMLIGLVSPRILLPVNIIENKNIYYVLRHELTHYKRGDLWWKQTLTILETLLWFYPPIYILCSKVERQLEYSCDECLAKKLNMIHRKKYALTILETICHTKPQHGQISNLRFATNQSLTMERLRNMIYVKKPSTYSVFVTFVISCLIVATLVLPSFAMPDKSCPYIMENIAITELDCELLTMMGYGSSDSQE